jgi:tetratricopeptide (TPR) repeat protein
MDSTDQFQNFLDECDRQLKSGNINHVQSKIQQMQFSQIPRDFRQNFAKICRRAALISDGLRVLHPIIRQEKLSDVPATEGEICEYAVLLLRNGSIPEALTLLEQLDPIKTPDALLNFGYAYIAQWEYAKAADYFQQFLISGLDPYQKLIARVNLASCYVVLGKLDEALILIEETLELAQKAQSPRLTGNCYELLGQVFFWKNDFAKSRECLKQALQILGNANSYDELLIRKTESIMQALETQSAGPLIRFQKEALERKHWESVRESDLFQLKVKFEQKALDHLMFGTPHPRYRERIESLVGAPPSSTYMLGSSKKLLLDLNNGTWRGKSQIKAGQKIHQVLSVLTRDFYAPRTLGSVFSELYPDEYFNVQSSPFRIHQLIMRTRRWLEENKIPALIKSEDGTFKFSIKGEFGLIVPYGSDSVDSVSVRLKQLQHLFPNEKLFSASEAAKLLKMNLRAFQRLADVALKDNELERIGVSRSTRYFIPDISKQKKSA